VRLCPRVGLDSPSSSAPEWKTASLGDLSDWFDWVLHANKRARRRNEQGKDPDKDDSTDEESPVGGAPAGAAETDVEDRAKKEAEMKSGEETNGRRKQGPGAAGILVVDVSQATEPPVEAGK
jgi:hypothetical protein